MSKFTELRKCLHTHATHNNTDKYILKIIITQIDCDLPVEVYLESFSYRDQTPWPQLQHESSTECQNSALQIELGTSKKIGIQHYIAMSLSSHYFKPLLVSLHLRANGLSQHIKILDTRGSGGCSLLLF